jgi:hypothetical protein
MQAQIELVKGNIFDGPTDLLVIPCSTKSTIEWFIEERLQSFNIPGPPSRKMQLGDVIFTDLRHTNNMAKAAAYAASVERMYPTAPKVIETIGRTLGAYAAENSWLGQMACPLLGTGAGKLEAVEATRALASGYLATAPERALLRIFILDDHVFERIHPLLLSEL